MIIVRNRFSELLDRKCQQEDRRIPLTEVGRKAKVSTSTLSSWYHNQVVRFDGSTIAALCFYLPCTLAELLVLIDTDDGRQEAR